jgi:hypothetical protein
MSVNGFVPAIVAAAVLLIVPASAFAQQVGVKAGINYTYFLPEEDDEAHFYSWRPGPVAGVWFGVPLTTRFPFQVEVLFSEKGVRFDGRAVGFDSDVDIRIRYLEIPLLARANFGAPGASMRTFLVGGVAPAFRLSARDKATFEGQEHTIDRKDQWKPFDLGLVGGVGVEFGPALVEARYTHGIPHINEDDNGEEDRARNRVFSVTVGFRLR